MYRQSDLFSPVMPEIQIVIALEIMDLDTLVTKAHNLVRNYLIFINKITVRCHPQIKDIAHQDEVRDILATTQATQEFEEQFSPGIGGRADMEIGNEVGI